MPDQRKHHLKTGFTTGTAAAAAAKGAVLALITDSPPTQVEVRLLTGDQMVVSIEACKRISDATAECLVIKDAGDDPDVTHQAQIGARVTLRPGGNQPRIDLKGGKGVGVVTKPGLEVPMGQPAINPGPQKMIRQAVGEILKHAAHRLNAEIEVFVPLGEQIARKTLNAKLGILGGISILGTTGLVKPLSHAAYIATIRSCLSVASALNIKEVVLTTGRRSERFAQQFFRDKPEEAFIQIGDYFKKSLLLAESCGMQEIILAVFFGKACKMAMGIPHTHAAKSELTLKRLGDWAGQTAGDRRLGEKVSCANTARQAFFMLKDQHREVIHEVGRRIIIAARTFLSQPVAVESIIFDFDGTVFFNSRLGERPLP